MITDDTGNLHHLRWDQKLNNSMMKTYKLKTTADADGKGEPTSWKSQGFTSTEYCYADSVFLV